MQKHGCTRKAIEEIIRICVDKDVLAKYLKERKVEIMDIMTALFDKDEVARRYYLCVQQQGANGMAVNNAHTMLKDGMPVEIVAKYSHLPVSEVSKLKVSSAL